MLAPDSLGGWVLLLGVVLPTIAFVEEFIFRAAAIGAVAAGFGISPWLPAVVSSLAFGIAHGAQGRVGVVVTGTLGFALAAGSSSPRACWLSWSPTTSSTRWNWSSTRASVSPAALNTFNTGRHDQSAMADPFDIETSTQRRIVLAALVAYLALFLVQFVTGVTSQPRPQTSCSPRWWFQPPST